MAAEKPNEFAVAAFALRVVRGEKYANDLIPLLQKAGRMHRDYDLLADAVLLAIRARLKQYGPEDFTVEHLSDALRKIGRLPADLDLDTIASLGWDGDGDAAYEAGAKAARKGVGPDCNPHDAGSHLCKRWDAGYFGTLAGLDGADADS